MSVLFYAFVIFFGAAILGTIAILTRQSLLLAYMVLGMLLGPWGFKVIPDSKIVSDIGDIGVIFLLFLLGLHLQPRHLVASIKGMLTLTVVGSLVLGALGFGVGFWFHYTLIESVVLGCAMMFSSTVIGLKLLPTTILHHRRIGEIMITILLLQDLLAVLLLLFFESLQTHSGMHWSDLLPLVVYFPLLILASYLGVRFVLIKLFIKFDVIQEYIWLIAIAWCLLLGQVADWCSLTVEVGAFVAGVSLATYPISQYIAESFKPFRDLFLVAFFFSVGAHFNFAYLPSVIFPAVILAVVILLIKPMIFRWLLVRHGEASQTGWEIGIRLGQNSEFSLLIAYIAGNMALIGEKTSFLIQAVTILSFVVSSYWVVLKYPTPLALTAKLRQD